MIFGQDRAGQDSKYAIDATKLENEPARKTNEGFESVIIKRLAW